MKLVLYVPTLRLIAACAATLAATAHAAVENELTVEDLQTVWAPIFAALAPDAGLKSDFVEQRRFSFRNEAVELRGEMRLAPGRGLSLHYTAPETRTIIVDDRGILLRDERGRTRKAPAEAASSAQLLLPVLRFDWVELAKTFTFSGQREGDTWELTLRPHDRKTRRPPPTIVLRGTIHRLDTLVLQPSARQTIEISIGATEKPATFTDEALRRYFR